MNQIEIGSFIAKRRKEKNLTQAKLAEILGVTNKTISKWETGKCMPDYNIIQRLCDELDISISELIDAEKQEPDSIRTYDGEQMLDMLKRVQSLENQKRILQGALLIVIGLTLLSLHYAIGGDAARDFVSIVFLGLSIIASLVGIFIAVTAYMNQK